MAYTTDTNKLKITELDFDSIKDALKTYLKGQDTFKDYNFEGSALNILLDILAYNTHYNGFYTNMLASEMFMDSASLRSSVVSLAKHLGYTPASRKGSAVDINFTLTMTSADATAARTIPLPKNTKFTSKINDLVYTFLTTEAATGSLGDDNQTYTFSNISLKEGVVFASQYEAEGTTGEVFTIPNENVDLDTLLVTKGGYIYNKADDITEISSTDRVYFVQEGRNGLFEIYFGNSPIGVGTETGENIQIEYFVTLLGEEGNGAKNFTLATVVDDSSHVYALTSTSAVSIAGAERETTDTVRIQAPRQYALQKRVVSADDYRARLLNDYSVVDAVRVWGGEDNDPPAYGKVFISLKPKDGYVLSEAERKVIKDDILQKRNMVTITPVFVDPDYLNLVLDCKVTYDGRQTVRNDIDLKAIVENVIRSYSTSTLEKFDEYYRNSVLTKNIDNSETSISNSLIDVKLKKSFMPTPGYKEKHIINFDNPLYHPHFDHMSILDSTKFTVGNFDNCSFTDRNGKVYITRRDSETGAVQASTAEEGVVGTLTNKDVGTIDYETGQVVIDYPITSIDDNSSSVHLTVVPRIENIISKQNTILTIGSSDISVEMINDVTVVESKKVQGY